MTINMERVSYNLHSNVCSIVLRKTTFRTRSLAEHFLLLVALCGFGVLCISHLAFVHRSSPAAQWLQRRNSNSSIPLQCLLSIQGYEKQTNVTHVVLWERDYSVAYSISQQQQQQDYWSLDCKNETSTPAKECSERDSRDESTCPSIPSQHDITLSFSTTKGFLYLPLSTSVQHNVSTQYVFITKKDTHCFGEPFLQTLVERILGVDTVALNWFLAAHDGHGFVLYPRTRQVVDLSASQHYSLWKSTPNYRHPLLFKAGVILTSVFLFFITTTLVSFTLTETQDRMLQFTFQLQAHVGADLPLAKLILTHVVENLVFVPIMVGMMFFLIEFYGGDKLLAFMVMSIVWVCEVFSTIAIRSIQGMQFFPKIFFLLFSLFHVYFFSCPFGFSYMALASTACFMIHSMLFFWHRYELPAVAHGLVTIHNPRMGVTTTEMETVPFMPNDLNNQRQEQDSRPVLPPRNPFVMHQGVHSHPSTSSLGRNSTSRPPSSTGLPFHGDDDGDGSESYMYFMNGEVVMHREGTTRARSQSISTSGSLDQETLSWNGTASPVLMTDSSGNNAVNLTAPDAAAIATAARQVHDDTIGMESPSHETQQQLQNSSQQEVDTDLTPRIGSASSREIDPTTANGPLPMFPVGVFRRTRR